MEKVIEISLYKYRDIHLSESGQHLHFSADPKIISTPFIVCPICKEKKPLENDQLRLDFEYECKAKSKTFIISSEPAFET
ncbi:MAG TPA: hypothetical protein P5158_07785 [Chitinophagaceae bacterium]|nr:hypothetical protein [Chitinophagaceae bacterium]